jgi:integrase
VQTVKHHPALDYRDMERCILEFKKKSSISASTLEFLILTARQTGEVIGARREEIDIDKKHPFSHAKASLLCIFNDVNIIIDSLKTDLDQC